MLTFVGTFSENARRMTGHSSNISCANWGVIVIFMSPVVEMPGFGSINREDFPFLWFSIAAASSTRCYNVSIRGKGNRKQLTCREDQKSFSDSFPLITTARCKAARSGSLSKIFFRNRNIIAAASLAESAADIGFETGGSAEVLTGGLGGGGPSSSIDEAGEGAAYSNDNRSQ
jgi:hypothetical protein